MRYTIQLLIMLGLIVLSQAACKKDCEDPTNPDCSNYDPCHIGPLTGEIQMEETIGFGFAQDPYRTRYPEVLATVQDTVLQGRTIVFTALDEADRYEWTIGSDSRIFRQRTFDLSFFRAEPNLIPTTLAVTLRSYRDNPNPCYPSDTVSESVRFLTVVSQAYTLLWGKYKGVSSIAPNDSFTVNIYDAYGSGGLDGYLIDGIMPNCTYPYSSSHGFTGFGMQVGYYKGLFRQNDIYTSLPDCYTIQGIAELASNRQDIRIQYFLKTNGDLEELNQEFVFTGIRVD